MKDYPLYVDKTGTAWPCFEIGAMSATSEGENFIYPSDPDLVEVQVSAIFFDAYDPENGDFMIYDEANDRWFPLPKEAFNERLIKIDVPAPA